MHSEHQFYTIFFIFRRNNTKMPKAHLALGIFVFKTNTKQFSVITYFVLQE